MSGDQPDIEAHVTRREVEGNCRDCRVDEFTDFDSAAAHAATERHVVITKTKTWAVLVPPERRGAG